VLSRQAARAAGRHNLNWAVEGRLPFDQDGSRYRARAMWPLRWAPILRVVYVPDGEERIAPIEPALPECGLETLLEA